MFIFGYFSGLLAKAKISSALMLPSTASPPEEVHVVFVLRRTSGDSESLGAEDVGWPSLLFFQVSMRLATCPGLAGDSCWTSRLTVSFVRWKSESTQNPCQSIFVNQSNHQYYYKPNHQSSSCQISPSSPGCFDNFISCVTSEKEASASGSNKRPRPSITGMESNGTGSGEARGEKPGSKRKARWKMRRWDDALILIWSDFMDLMTDFDVSNLEIESWEHLKVHSDCKFDLLVGWSHLKPLIYKGQRLRHMMFDILALSSGAAKKEKKKLRNCVAHIALRNWLTQNLKNIPIPLLFPKKMKKKKKTADYQEKSYAEKFLRRGTAASAACYWRPEHLESWHKTTALFGASLFVLIKIFQKLACKKTWNFGKTIMKLSYSKQTDQQSWNFCPWAHGHSRHGGRSQGVVQWGGPCHLWKKHLFFCGKKTKQNKSRNKTKTKPFLSEKVKKHHQYRNAKRCFVDFGPSGTAYPSEFGSNWLPSHPILDKKMWEMPNSCDEKRLKRYAKNTWGSTRHCHLLGHRSWRWQEDLKGGPVTTKEMVRWC